MRVYELLENDDFMDYNFTIIMNGVKLIYGLPCELKEVICDNLKNCDIYSYRARLKDGEITIRIYVD